jgi:hypothetical protein
MLQDNFPDEFASTGRPGRPRVPVLARQEKPHGRLPALQLECPGWTIGEELTILERHDLIQTDLGNALGGQNAQARTEEALRVTATTSGRRIAPSWMKLSRSRCWRAWCDHCGMERILTRMQIASKIQCVCQRRTLSRSRPGAQRYAEQVYSRLYCVEWVDQGTPATRGWLCECWCGKCAGGTEIVGRSRDLARRGRMPCPHPRASA